MGRGEGDGVADIVRGKRLGEDTGKFADLKSEGQCCYRGNGFTSKVQSLTVFLTCPELLYSAGREGAIGTH